MNNSPLQKHSSIQLLSSKIENLKYDRELLIQESSTFRGMLNKRHLSQQIDEINRKIRDLQLESKKIEQSSLSTSLVSILFVAAEPDNAVKLRLSEEFREIHEKLRLAQLRDMFRLELPQLSARPEDITQGLLDTRPNVVHFSGHGNSQGALYFENQNRQVQLVEPNALAALFKQFTSHVRCVLLNACYSEIQAKAIVEHIDYVIGMTEEIGNKASIWFSVGFYQALGGGKTIEEAYELGCTQINLQGIYDYPKPVLLKNSHLKT